MESRSKERIWRLYAFGLTNEDISNETGLSITYVEAMLRVLREEEHRVPRYSVDLPDPVRYAPGDSFPDPPKPKVESPKPPRPPKKPKVVVSKAEFEDPVPLEGDYFRWLRSIEPESLRRAWLDGDFHALSGTYFKDFRANGPLSGEPVEAMHVFDEEAGQPLYQRLEPWWHTWVGLDWGYIHPTVWHCHKKSPEGRIFTFRERVFNRIEPYELGVTLAYDLKSIVEESQSKRVICYISPDACARTESEDTPAIQMVPGINHVLGPKSAFLMKFTEAEEQMREEEALASMLQRRDEQRDLRVVLVPANNNRVAGWMHLQTLLRFKSLETESVPDMVYAFHLMETQGVVAQMEYLNQPEFSKAKVPLPRWKISRQCVQLIKCLQTAMHKPGTNDIAKTDASESSIGDDACFTAGTPIGVEGGNMAIEEVRPGDKVWTREGLRVVRDAGVTGVREVQALLTTSGRVLVGSGSHPIWVRDIGWRRLDSLRYGDILDTWSKPLSSMGSDLGDTQSPSVPILESTTGQELVIGCGELEHSTKKFGDSITALTTLVLSTFTMLMRILSITTSSIWRNFPHLSICLCTPGIRSTILGIWPESDLSLGHGTPQPRVGCGIDPMQKAPSKNLGSLLLWCARSAVLSLYPRSNTGLDSAPITANPRPVGNLKWMMLRGFASSVALGLRRINTLMSPTAPDRVLCRIPVGREPVFNLSVDGIPEYYANGILVHNCDAARYGLISEERQTTGKAPLMQRVDERMKQFDTPGYSDHSRFMARQMAIYNESGQKREEVAQIGHNRLAVRRAMLQDRAKELTRAMQSRRVM